ncbi:uncharacterized protein [Prorops nasuta]|uniref:uncharacterized protein n=1 Tax=Prorops nasuta TaxID=863751 RepID=UPI0034CEDB2C
MFIIFAMTSRVYSHKKGVRGASGSNKRPKISRKRPFNRHELDTPIESEPSISARKLKMSDDFYDIEVDSAFGYRIINFIAVFSTISNFVVCKVCKSEVKFTENGIRGLGFKVVITCETCEKKEIPSCPFINKGYEVNRRIIFAMRLLGIGLHGIIKFCAFMELPRPVFHSFYDNVIRSISSSTDVVCQISISRAAKEEKESLTKTEEPNGLTVSGDGTWRKRGFSSLYGLVTLIGWHTGKVIDYVVKSKYCKSCEHWQKKEETEEYKEWIGNHVSECLVNHEGSAGKMEVDGVIEMFQRSVNLHNVKYANYIGDGDSKTFKAIRRNSDSVDKMRSAIWATLDHKLSTNENPKHDRCPIGKDSWCSWQKASATNNLGSYEHKPAMSVDVYEAIKPVYEELSNDNLLTRCIGGYTQNRNESFNSTVWALAPKSISSGKIILDIATNIAVCVYNNGFASILHMILTMGMKIGQNSYNMCIEIDAHRMKLAERSRSRSAKEARSSLKTIRKTAQDQNINEEGQLYGAGIAE